MAINNPLTFQGKQRSDVSGTHDIHCIMCGEVYLTITHNSDKIIIKQCKECERALGLCVCYKCWSERKNDC